MIYYGIYRSQLAPRKSQKQNRISKLTKNIFQYYHYSYQKFFSILQISDIVPYVFGLHKSIAAIGLTFNTQTVFIKVFLNVSD